MKNKIILLTLIIAMGLTGCSSEKKETDVTEAVPSQTSAVSESAADTTAVSETEKENSVSEETTTEEIKNQRVHIDFEEIRFEEYNNKGCELPAICALLHYYGIEAAPSDIYEHLTFVTKDTLSEDLFWKAWYDSLLTGYAPVIEEAADKMLIERKSEKTIESFIGEDLNYLLEDCVKNGEPIMVWATYKLVEPKYETDDWYNMTEYEFTHDNYCYVITGYDENIIEAYEPYSGKIEEYDRELFEQRYNDMFRQAIVIKVDNNENKADTTVISEEETKKENHIDFEEIRFEEYNNKGCELPAICALLHYHGIDMTPSEFYQYVPASSVNTPAEDILWKTWDTSSCYAPVIDIALEGVWVDKETNGKKVYLKMDCELEEILSEYTANNIPAMIWGTINLNKPEFRTDYAGDGAEFEYTNDAQCYIITGYDENIIEAYEPYSGKIEEYDRELFEQRYNDMFRQAIIIN
ncbi:MAG: C39 family peptidase [Oscillospiraceae bacterium]|nr:C39 family peptidase [Oscillospiraceae bacterium]